jgi:hypothetical protein
LSDRVAVGVLTQALPQSLVDDVLAETGRVQQRNRLLPARLVVYFVLAMFLFFGQSYEEVARLLTAGLQDARRLAYVVGGAECGGDLESQVPAGSGAARAVRAGVLPVRAVKYTIAGHEGVYRLITTILDPHMAPTAELAALYAQRWEFESTLDEIKTHLGGRHLVLRSQHPDGAEQELYGFLLVHHAIRHLMHQAARQADGDPDRISFTRSLRVVRRQVTDQAASSPRPTPPRGQSHPR